MENIPLQLARLKHCHWLHPSVHYHLVLNGSCPRFQWPQKIITSLESVDAWYDLVIHYMPGMMGLAICSPIHFFNWIISTKGNSETIDESVGVTNLTTPLLGYIFYFDYPLFNLVSLHFSVCSVDHPITTACWTKFPAKSNGGKALEGCDPQLWTLSMQGTKNAVPQPTSTIWILHIQYEWL